MSTPSIHQFVAGYAVADAISNEVRLLQAIFQSWGAPSSHVFAERNRVDLDYRDSVKDIREDIGLIKPTDIAILHLSIGCAANQVFKDLPCKKVIRYHNITPPDFFRGYNEQVVSVLEKGHREIASLAHVADLVLADSQFNADDLSAMGYPPATVFPLVLDFSTIRGKASKRSVRAFSDGLTNILFVGRCAPNKRIEDLLDAFYYYQRYVNPSSRLIHAGSYAGADQYHVLLLARARELNLKNCLFTGSVPQEELNAYYQTAHVFLCMSEHEGFCVPLIEAMANNVPVAAYAAGAVPETMDGAGVLFHKKDYALIAETIHQLATPTPLRTAVLAAQAARMARFEHADLPARLHTLLSPLFPA